VHNRVKSFEVLRSSIPNIPRTLLIPQRLGTEVTSVVPSSIQADDLMTSSLHKGCEYRAYVAAVADH
jgi:hypothetical protein